MRRHVIALGCALAVLLTAGSGVAAAQSVQGVEQNAKTGQSASSNASSTQTSPSNSNISVRIFSPGDGGSVKQENSSAAGAAAANQAATVQDAAQSQSGGGGEQAVGQEALTSQEADADATSQQISPTNKNISVRIHSPGDDGDVSQSNASTAGALAKNEAATKQSADQDQGDRKGGCCSEAGVQAVGQKAGTWQDADADAESVQYKPSNTNVSVRIGSKGDGGAVSQSNTSDAKAAAGNKAATIQEAEQDQDRGRGCKCGGDLVQAVGQKAVTVQEADADATSIQKGASNTNVPLRIFSAGDDGDVEQTNASNALAGAFNAAVTKQAVDQDQRDGCKCDGKGKDRGKDKGGKDDRHDGAAVQAVGQWAETWQDADADAESKQEKPSNKNAPVRIKSKGDAGKVEQTNASLAGALALNRAFTFQGVEQDQ